MSGPPITRAEIIRALQGAGLVVLIFAVAIAALFWLEPIFGPDGSGLFRAR